MLLAEAATATAAAAEKVDTGFNYFVVIFTIIIAIGIFRLATSPKKNLFALGWSSLCLLVFLSMDAIMVSKWMGLM